MQTDFTLPVADERFSKEEKVNFYRQEFLSFVGDMSITPQSLVWAWHIWSLLQVESHKGIGRNGSLDFHLNYLLQCLDRKEKGDGTTISLALFPMQLSVIEASGTTPKDSILFELPEEKIASAQLFCLEMLKVGWNPSVLNEMEEVSAE